MTESADRPTRRVAGRRHHLTPPSTTSTRRRCTNLWRSVGIPRRRPSETRKRRAAQALMPTSLRRCSLRRLRWPSRLGRENVANSSCSGAEIKGVAQKANDWFTGGTLPRHPRLCCLGLAGLFNFGATEPCRTVSPCLSATRTSTPPLEMCSIPTKAAGHRKMGTSRRRSSASFSSLGGPGPAFSRRSACTAGYRAPPRNPMPARPTTARPTLGPAIPG